MGRISIVALAVSAICGSVFAATPAEVFRGKMKEGLYEYKMDIEMPGMPAGMGKQSHTMEHCVTPKEIEGGDFAKRDKQSSCDIRDLKSSGNTVTYKMVCTGKSEMTADTKMTFKDNGFTSDMTMAMNQRGQVMNMHQHMEGTYKGPCK
jgi:uncharacterized protein DUF3617